VQTDIRAGERLHYPVASSGTIRYGRIEVVRVLPEHGTNVDVEDDDRNIINQVMGKTPLTVDPELASIVVDCCCLSRDIQLCIRNFVQGTNRQPRIK
jgi:hypothetical protein